jgi:hypothetical protein
LSRTKSKVGLGQGNAGSENKTEDHAPNTTRQFHTIFLLFSGNSSFSTGGFLIRLPDCNDGKAYAKAS